MRRLPPLQRNSPPPSHPFCGLLLKKSCLNRSGLPTRALSLLPQPLDQLLFFFQRTPSTLDRFRGNVTTRSLICRWFSSHLTDPLSLPKMAGLSFFVSTFSGPMHLPLSLRVFSRSQSSRLHPPSAVATYQFRGWCHLIRFSVFLPERPSSSPRR